MFKNYLLNLYKNLNLYSNFDFSDYINANKKNINIMIGGADPDHYQKVFLELIEIIKEDLNKIKSNQPLNTDEIAVKLRTFKVFAELYQNYISQLMDEHQIAKGKIDNIDTIATNPDTLTVINAVQDLSRQFEELLEP